MRSLNDEYLAIMWKDIMFVSKIKYGVLPSNECKEFACRGVHHIYMDSDTQRTCIHAYSR